MSAVLDVTTNYYTSLQCTEKCAAFQIVTRESFENRVRGQQVAMSNFAHVSRGLYFVQSNKRHIAVNVLK
ncbi:hypothetical protein V1478_010551 [Vespula squamosa]|uniref:Uncharacterized protein n=1 Tax=Vespula squamosa TaxID=30214 RepID=A0ABD2AIC8_VESSQ